MSEEHDYAEIEAGLAEIAREVRQCTACELHKGRTRAVPGEGPVNADIMFIGEAPGRNEDQQGRPFVGQAGKLLEELLAEIELTRHDVWIGNVVKCFVSPDVKIYTTTGYRRITDLRRGDRVLTHAGRFRRVVYLRPRELLPEGAEVVELVAQPAIGTTGPVRLTVTPEHPFLINGQWTPAARIKVGDAIRALGERCAVCRQPFYARYDNYDDRPLPICQRCQVYPSRPQRVPDARVVAMMPRHQESQLRTATAAAEPMDAPERASRAQQREEYTYVDIEVASVTLQRTQRSVPLYNIGVEEDESYIADGFVSHNCRPPENRDPRPEEIAACAGYLERQIDLLKPKLIATLGRYSMEKFFPGAKITRVHGQARRDGRRVLIPLFHPAYVLRNMAAMPDAVRDMQKIPRLLARLEEVLQEEGPNSAPAEPEVRPPDPEQLSLF